MSKIISKKSNKATHYGIFESTAIIICSFICFFIFISVLYGLYIIISQNQEIEKTLQHLSLLGSYAAGLGVFPATLVIAIYAKKAYATQTQELKSAIQQFNESNIIAKNTLSRSQADSIYHTSKKLCSIALDSVITTENHSHERKTLRHVLDSVASEIVKSSLENKIIREIYFSNSNTDGRKMSVAINQLCIANNALVDVVREVKEGAVYGMLFHTEFEHYLYTLRYINFLKSVPFKKADGKYMEDFEKYVVVVEEKPYSTNI